MMMWNNIPNDERIRLWKNLRQDISGLSTEDRLSEVAKFCFSMPIGARTLDYYDPSNWPTPWEILFHGSFCSSSISLLMFHTLAMVSDEDTIELLLVEDPDGIYLLPLVNYHFVLNYELGMVSMYSNVQESFTVLQRYTRDQVKTIK